MNNPSVVTIIICQQQQNLNYLNITEKNRKQAETGGESAWKRRMALDEFPMFITFSHNIPLGSQNLNRILNRLTSLNNQKGAFGVASAAGKWVGKWQIHKGGALNSVNKFTHNVTWPLNEACMRQFLSSPAKAKRTEQRFQLLLITGKMIWCLTLGLNCLLKHTSVFFRGP